MNQERAIYFSEIVDFFQKKRRAIFLVGFCSLLLSFFFILLFSKPHFQAEATFRKAQNHTEENTSLQSILKTMHFGKEETSAISIMCSKQLLKKVVEKTGLQILPIQEKKISSLLLAEIHKGKGNETFSFRDVKYKQETPFSFFMKPLNQEEFEILDLQKKQIIQGRVNQPISFQEATFTIISVPSKKKLSKFQIISQRKAALHLREKLTFKTSRIDPQMIQLKFSHFERNVAISTLDAIMEEFQEYLRKEYEELASKQESYLKKRQEELSHQFNESLDEHTAYLKNSLGAEGFMNLTQQIEMLNEPKEKYLSKKHQLDLELKQWQQTSLEAKAEYPWKEGWGKKNELQWQEEKYFPTNVSTEEFAGIDLETTQKLYAEYACEKNELYSSISVLNSSYEKISDPEFELSALSQVLIDQISQKIIQKGAEISLQLADQNNRTEKELMRLSDALEKQKKFLQEHLSKKIEISQIQLSLVEEKMMALRQTALELIRQEKSHVEQKLQELTEKMKDFPEKWRLESQLKLKRELILQIIEGLTQLSEAKVINHHLFHVESKPLDFADAPLYRQSPHLVLYSSMGGILGALFFFIGSFLKAAIRGLPVSTEYLRDRKLPFAGTLKDPQTLKRIANEIQAKEIVAVLGEDISSDLSELLTKRGKKVLRIQLGKEKKLRHLKTHDVLGIRYFSKKVQDYKKDYDSILIPLSAKLNSPEGLESLHWADRFILILQDEKGEDLIPFEKKNNLCVFNK